MLTTTELANRLGLSKGRISQLVGAGRLDGCFTGAGRDRRFDLNLVQEKLRSGLDFGQMLGNGSKTRSVLNKIASESDSGSSEVIQVAPAAQQPRDGSELPVSDAGRYEMARAQKAEEEARAMRRRNQEAEGKFVLASEVDRQVRRVVAQEIAEVESFIRSSARDVADRLGVDFKAVRQILLDGWRSHRSGRAEALESQASVSEMTEAETGADI